MDENTKKRLDQQFAFIREIGKIYWETNLFIGWQAKGK